MADNYSELTISEAKDLLRQWRDNNERKSDEVLKVWSVIFGGHKNGVKNLGNEKHLILEQVFYAALDCHYYTMASYCSMTLQEEFPDSYRAAKLTATLYEAQENYEDALAMLDNIIRLDETNAAARKRVVAILKAQGLIQSAIKELVDYLKKFMSDVEAWQELSELYLQAQEYSRAAFCCEEILLHQPHNHLAHQRLADVRYTMGGVENMELAKTYYCSALKLNPDNMRALLGLFLTTNNLLSHYKSAGQSGKRKEAWRVCRWAQARAAPPRAPGANLAAMMLQLAIAD
ncbi:ER membrane protein complex subunit 2-like [Ostrinia nubilalis]|uniref:ER membrane protein complex subunit 2-like n=1 Tax=Ostrinia nubilalis TaxID=29057 RepID=UPI001039BDD1|nr:ER membrane protein complex subunit 2-like isoform X1 [Ostrinia furnacalis]XP_028161204.1 ER membrane protein complex subunit 2-like isoform X2 [Ostrinia furnacalis]XP_028161205.1 ER membrane protein complex subunit 2-like isoform X3 [Ostrinia furnacalis]